MDGSILFYLGIGGMSAAAAGGVLAVIILRGAGKRLRRQLESEYGKQDQEAGRWLLK